MNIDYGDKPTIPNRLQRNCTIVVDPQPAMPRCNCGSVGRLVIDDFGYVVTCVNRFCDGFRFAPDESCDDPAAAVELWTFKQTGRVQ